MSRFECLYFDSDSEEKSNDEESLEKRISPVSIIEIICRDNHWSVLLDTEEHIYLTYKFGRLFIWLSDEKFNFKFKRELATTVINENELLKLYPKYHDEIINGIINTKIISDLATHFK